MPRLELREGNLERFWEIEQRDNTLCFRFGDLGGRSHTREKTYATEIAARRVAEEALQAMLSQGYTERIGLTVPRSTLPPPGWSALIDDPTDDVAWAVLGDWLQAQGDPRGEVIALSLAGQEALAKDRLDANIQRFAGPLDQFEGSIDLEWRRGYVHRAVCSSSLHNVEGLVNILRADGFQLVEHLTLRVPSAVGVCHAVPLSALRSLAICTGGGRASGCLCFDTLAQRFPRLCSLAVRGVTETTGDALFEQLTELDVRLSDGWAPRIRRMPQRRRLRLSAIQPSALRELLDCAYLRGLQELQLSLADTAPLYVLSACPPKLILDGALLTEQEVQVILRLQGLQELELGSSVTQRAAELLKESELLLTNKLRIQTDPEELPEPVRPPHLRVQRLELDLGERGYFWEIARVDAIHHVRTGWLHADCSKWSYQRFPTEDVAREMWQQRIDAKRAEGYRLVQIG